MEIMARSGISWPQMFFARGGILLALYVNFGVYMTIYGSKSLLSGIVVFSFFTLTFRILSTIFILHEPVRGANLVALVALCMAFLAGIVWRH